MQKNTFKVLALSVMVFVLNASADKPIQTGSVYPNPHLSPPTQPVPAPADQEARNMSDKRLKSDYNQQLIYVRPAVSVGYGYHHGWRSHPYHHVGAGFYPYY